MIQPNKTKQWILALAGLASFPLGVLVAIINPFNNVRDSGFGFGAIEYALGIIAIIHIIAIIITLVILIVIKVSAVDNKLLLPLKVGLIYYTIIAFIASNEPGFNDTFSAIQGLFRSSQPIQ